MSQPTSPSSSSSDGPTTLSFHVPRRLVILPPAALALGVAIGMSRGGSRARLRFLAENVHRQPTTVQGWYFYTKTRNYRILFGALRQGARDGLRLGAATALYVLVEEGVVKARHAAGLGLGNDDLQGSEAAASRRKGKEPVRVDFEKAQSVESHEVEEELSRSRLAQVIRVMADRTEDGYQWLDGGIAGTALGLVVGAWNRFPLPLLLRTMIMGTTLGTFEGGLRIVQAKIGELKRDEEEESRRRKEMDAQEEVATRDGQGVEVAA